jgi:hypothetical protein
VSYMNCRVKRAGLGVALLWGILGLILLLPATVWAGGHTVMVPPPNGVDDTANIQAALDACVAYGPGCTVQFPVGNYLTKQLVAYNFRGNFKGMGRDHTIIAALPYLLVNFQANEGSLCRPEPGKCFWPTVIVFVDGSIQVSDLSLVVPATNGTATLPWEFAGITGYIGLAGVMTFTGQHVTAKVDRIHSEGRLDPTNQYFGYNVVMALDFNGTLPRSSKPFDWYFVSGSFTVGNSLFSTAYVGISVWGFIRSSYITIGGSPDAGNRIENGYGGFDLETSQSSFFDVSYNQSSASGAAAWVVPWSPQFVPTSPSQYLIHDNKFIATAQNADGLLLYDDVTNPWIQAVVWNNAVRVKDILSEGIGVHNTSGTAVWNNSVAGSDGYDGIGLWGSTLSTVAGNHVSGFTIDNTVGLAQIFLDPATSYDLVVCSNSKNSVLDQGTMNKVVGCQQSAASAEAATSAAPNTSAARANLLRKKPRVPQ